MRKPKQLLLNLFTLVFITAFSYNVSAENASLTIQSHTADDAGFRVNSHLIAGKQEAILVDAQFTRSEAAQVVKMVKQSGKHLKTIFITHGHPDHYLGLEVLQQHFPTAKIVATQAVIDEIKQSAAGKIAYWKASYKDNLADNFSLPALVKPADLQLGKQTIQLVELKAGESEHAAALYLPSIKTLIAGDLIYSGVHLWLAENRPEQWLANLQQIKKLGPIEQVLPGHGANGKQDLLDTNQTYIERFIAATSNSVTKEQAITQMKALYPNYVLPIILELSVAARIK